MILRKHFFAILFAIVCVVPWADAASISGTWSLKGYDSTDTDPADGLGRVNILNQPFLTSIAASRSGVPGYTEHIVSTGETRFVPSSGLAPFTPDVHLAVQQIVGHGTSYGDLKAMASVSLGAFGQRTALPNLVSSISAGVKITSSDRIRYFFKPTASKPLPDPLVINLALDAIFETQMLSGTIVRETSPGSGVYAHYPYSPSTYYEGTVIATAQGPKAYFLDEVGSPAPMGLPAQLYMQVVPGSFFGGEGTIRLSDTLQLFVQPEYTLPADRSAPFLVTQEFKIGLQSMAVSEGGKSVADASHTLLIDSITFPDGSTPESHGYQLEFESGHLSPNLRQVPEPASATLAGVTLLLALAAGCQRQR